MRPRPFIACTVIALAARTAAAQPAPAAPPSPFTMTGAHPAPRDWTSSTGEPTIVAADGLRYLLPQEIPYDPEMGRPPGYKLVEEHRNGLMTGGVVTFGGLYVISCLAAGLTQETRQTYRDGKDGWPLYIPFAGPFAAIATLRSGPSGTTALVLDGILQVAAAAMFITGVTYPRQVLKYQFQLSALRLTVTPLAGPLEEGGFAGLRGTF